MCFAERLLTNISLMEPFDTDEYRRKTYNTVMGEVEYILRDGDIICDPLHIEIDGHWYYMKNTSVFDSLIHLIFGTYIDG